MEEEILEQRERAAHRLADRVRPVREALARAPRPTRATVAVVLLAVLMSDLAVVGARRIRNVVPVIEAGRGSDEISAESARGPAQELSGQGPFAVYAVEDGVEDRIRVFAADLGAAPNAGEFHSIFLGEYPGFVTDFAGSQGQAAGTIVPINTAQETSDASRATRLWLMRRGQTIRPLSTFDFVSAYAIDRTGTALAVSRRSVTSPGRGAFLWLYPMEPPGSRQVGSLRRPGGAGPADQLRPVAWGYKNRVIYAVPFCDECGADDTLRGMYVVTVADAHVRKLSLTGNRTVTSPSFSADGTRFVFQEPVRLQNCSLADRCEERRLVAVDLSAGRVRILARSTELSFDNPVLSMNGRFVAYASGRNHEIAWRSFDTGRLLGVLEVVPSEDVAPVAWVNDLQILVVGQTSSARPDGDPEGNLFRITRAILSEGSEHAGAHLDRIATNTTVIFLGWIA